MKFIVCAIVIAIALNVFMGFINYNSGRYFASGISFSTAIMVVVIIAKSFKKHLDKTNNS